MAKDWKNELNSIISSQQNSIKQVIDERDERENDRLKKIDEIKNIVRPRFEYIKEQIEKDKYLITKIETKESNTKLGKASSKEPEPPTREPEYNEPKSAGENGDFDFLDISRRGERVSMPKINEGSTEIVLIMPALSDVNRLDLMYQVEFRDEKPVLHAFNLLPAGKMENNGSAHDNYEDFVQDTLKRFLLSWFTRKEGTERDKERKFQLVIRSHGMKP